MAEAVQGALINEMLGRFIEDSVNRAVSECMRSLAEEADRKVAEAIEAGTSRLDAVMQRASNDVQTRIQQMLEHGMSFLLARPATSMPRLTRRSLNATKQVFRF